MKNGVGSDVYEGKNTLKKSWKKKKIRENEERKGRKKKNDRFSLSRFKWSLSFKGDFLKF